MRVGAAGERTACNDQSNQEYEKVRHLLLFEKPKKEKEISVCVVYYKTFAFASVCAVVRHAMMAG